MGSENFWDIDLDMDMDIDLDGEEGKNLVISTKSVNPKAIKYENAERLARQMDFKKEKRYECIIKGDFIFGDFIEAFFVKNNIHTKQLTISTLSFGRDNVDSLLNLIDGGFVDKLRILSSVYFYANEKGDGGIVNYLFDVMPKDKIVCAFADVHTKMVTFKTDGGRHMCITGSANLRSSGCVEQFAVEDNQELLEFFDSYHDQFFKMYERNGEKPMRSTTLNKEL